MQKIVVSLTSYPARINTVNQVIKSLFYQQEQADEIVLWLSTEEFPDKYGNLPEDLVNLIGTNNFRIEWVRENIKSHKKYYYALQDSRNITITVDDDMYYSDTLVSTLMDSYRKHPHAISARSVRIIMKENESIIPYIAWESEVSEYIDSERMDLCAIGVSGILYPPECAKTRWFDISTMMKMAKNQDDLWLKSNQIIDNIPVVYTGRSERDKIIENSQDTSLYFQNLYGGFNEISISKLFSKLEINHKMIYEKWHSKLMQVKDFIRVKRKFYKEQLEHILSQWNERDIYICGAGKCAHILYEFLKTCERENKIRAFLVIQKNSENDKIDVKYIKDLDKQSIFGVICGVGDQYREVFRKELAIYQFHEWADINISGLERLLQLEKTEMRRL